ncbi:hypothetical protein ACFS07_36240 [Undibacterium arcticum]
MRAGDVRVLIGSTAKMGAGTNVQNKLVAEHHIDCPWRPSDLEQREGRIIRQGNEFFSKPHRMNSKWKSLGMPQKKTYDSRMWQTIEYKAAGIEQFRKRGFPVAHDRGYRWRGCKRGRNESGGIGQSPDLYAGAVIGRAEES